MSRNPLRYTVRVFIARARREHEKECGKELRAKGPQKSNFVSFLESLENRGKIPAIGREDLYRKWTAGVRHEMQIAGTWPKPDQNLTLSVLAEYLSRLQAFFWREFPDDKCDKVDWFIVAYDPDNKFRPCRKVLRKIWLKIRSKGMRDKAYKMAKWGAHSPSLAWLMAYRDVRGCEEYKIHPYTPPSPPPPFMDFGLDI